MSRYYITTSIPYINGEPHLGHTLEYIQADVLARAARKRGDDVIFVTGTDEHGVNVERSAKRTPAWRERMDSKEVRRFRATVLVKMSPCRSTSA